jgi:hypothetical protein
MNHSRWPLVLLAVALFSTAGAVGFRQLEIAKSQQEIDTLRVELQARPERVPLPLAAEPEAATADPASAADLEAIDRLRVAVADLAEETRAAERRLAAHLQPVPETSWTNAGRGSARAVLETALWASRNGDAGALSEALVFDGYTSALATMYFNQLPPHEREEFGSIEKMIAIMAAAEMPTERARATIANPLANTTEATLEYRVGNTTRTVRLALQRHVDGWRIAVPPSAVSRYGSLLKGRMSASAAPR